MSYAIVTVETWSPLLMPLWLGVCRVIVGHSLVSCIILLGVLMMKPTLYGLSWRLTLVHWYLVRLQDLKELRNINVSGSIIGIMFLYVMQDNNV